MAFKDMFTLMSMEVQESETWEYDHNTTVLLIVQSNLAALLKASMIISNNFQNIENLDIINMVTGLTECLEWLQDNTEMVKKNGTR